MRCPGSPRSSHKQSASGVKGTISSLRASDSSFRRAVHGLGRGSVDASDLVVFDSPPVIVAAPDRRPQGDQERAAATPIE